MITKQTQVRLLSLSVVLLLILSLSIAGCRSKPQPTFDLQVSPETEEVQVGTEVAILAKVEPVEKLDLQWSVSGTAEGTLNTYTGERVIYTASKSGTAFVVAEGTTASGVPVKQTVTLTVVTPVPPTDTPSPTPTETVPLTDTLSPPVTETPTPQPVVEITNPVDAIDCPGTKECLFTVEGTSSNVVTNHDLRIYVFVFPVDPPGSGWYPQVSPATVKQDGTWSQTPAWLGSEQYPAESGHTFQIVALVVHKDADWNGTKLSEWSPGAAMPTYQDIDYVAVSDPLSLRVR